MKGPYTIDCKTLLWGQSDLGSNLDSWILTLDTSLDLPDMDFFISYSAF